MSHSSQSASSPSEIPAAGRKGRFVFGLAVGLPLVAMGVGFCMMLWTAYSRAKETRTWTPVTCVIETSEIESFLPTPNSPKSYRLNLSYRYRFEGVSRVGTRLKRVDGNSTKPKLVGATAKTYRPGTSQTCYVNPVDPEFAILEHAPLAPLYSIWFPGLFVVGGLGIIIGASRPK